MKYNVHLTPDGSGMFGVTKLDALLAKRDALQAELDANTALIAGLGKTPCGLTCEGCGTVLATERDFAAHFTIKRMDLLADRLNLGDCPKSSRS